MTSPALTFSHDGSCPLCRLEIGHYRRQRGAEHTRFVDVTDPSVDLGPPLSRVAAMGRLDARQPSTTPALEAGFRVVAPVRPHLADAVSRLGPA